MLKYLFKFCQPTTFVLEPRQTGMHTGISFWIAYRSLSKTRPILRWSWSVLYCFKTRFIPVFITRTIRNNISSSLSNETLMYVYSANPFWNISISYVMAILMEIYTFLHKVVSRVIFCTSIKKLYFSIFAVYFIYISYLSIRKPIFQYFTINCVVIYGHSMTTFKISFSIIVLALAILWFFLKNGQAF